MPFKIFRRKDLHHSAGGAGTAAHTGVLEKKLSSHSELGPALKEIKSNVPAERNAATERFIEFVLKKDDFKSFHDKIDCMRYMGELGYDEFLNPLLGILKNTINLDLRAEAAATLGKMKKEQAVPALIKSLSDPGTLVRIRTTSALGEIRTKNPEALTALKKRLVIEEKIKPLSEIEKNLQAQLVKTMSETIKLLGER